MSLPAFSPALGRCCSLLALCLQKIQKHFFVRLSALSMADDADRERQKAEQEQQITEVVRRVLAEQLPAGLQQPATAGKSCQARCCLGCAWLGRVPPLALFVGRATTWAALSPQGALAPAWGRSFRRWRISPPSRRRPAGGRMGMWMARLRLPARWSGGSRCWLPLRLRRPPSHSSWPPISPPCLPS